MTTIEQLEALYGQPYGPSVAKEIDYISPGYRKLIEAAPFVAIATGGPEGLDCSPKGDAPRFVRILALFFAFKQDMDGRDKPTAMTKTTLPSTRRRATCPACAQAQALG